MFTMQYSEGYKKIVFLQFLWSFIQQGRHFSVGRVHGLIFSLCRGTMHIFSFRIIVYSLCIISPSSSPTAFEILSDIDIFQLDIVLIV